MLRLNSKQREKVREDVNYWKAPEVTLETEFAIQVEEESPVKSVANGTEDIEELRKSLVLNDKNL